MNEYQKKYEDLINFRKNIQSFNRWNQLYRHQQEANLPPAYGEYHHIQPRCLRPDLATDPDNIVCLTAKEHILAHKYLAFWFKDEYGENSKEYIKMWLAYEKTTHDQLGNRRISDDELASMKSEKTRIRKIALGHRKMTPEQIKRLIECTTTPEAKKKKHDSFQRYLETPGTREAISKLRKEVANRPEVRAKNSAAQKLAQNQPEVKAKMSIAVRKAYERPEVKQHIIEANRRISNNPAVRKKLSISVKKKYEDPALREKVRNAVKQALAKPETRAKMQLANIRTFLRRVFIRLLHIAIVSNTLTV